MMLFIPAPLFSFVKKNIRFEFHRINSMITKLTIEQNGKVQLAVVLLLHSLVRRQFDITLEHIQTINWMMMNFQTGGRLGKIIQEPPSKPYFSAASRRRGIGGNPFPTLCWKFSISGGTIMSIENGSKIVGCLWCALSQFFRVLRRGTPFTALQTALRILVSS